MNTTATLPTRSNARRSVRKQFKNVEAFEAWAFEQERSYEFVDKKVVSKEMIKEDELIIIWWLNEFFKQTAAFKEKGALVGEVGLRLPNGNFRVPDTAYFTADQHFAAANGKHPTPELTIEILSKSESAQHIADKITDYFAAGVKVVWYIYPKTETIYVYTSPKNIKVCEGDDVCSAAPGLPDFEFPARAIFKKER